MGHALLINLQRAGPLLLRRLGVQSEHGRALDKLTTRALTLQLVAGALLGYLMALAAGRDVVGALMLAVLVPMFAVLASIASHWAQIGIIAVRRFVGAPLSIVVPARWARHSAWLGVGTMLVAGIVGQFGDAVVPWAATASNGLLVVALLLALPGEMTGIASVTFLWLLVDAVLPGHRSPLGACLLWAWLLAGALVYRQQIYVPNRSLLDFPQWPNGGVPAVALLSTVGLPTLLTWLGDHCGLRFTIAVFVLTGAVGMVTPAQESHLVWVLPLAFYSWIALLLALKRAGWFLGCRLLRDVQPG